MDVLRPRVAFPPNFPYGSIKFGMAAADEYVDALATIRFVGQAQAARSSGDKAILFLSLIVARFEIHPEDHSQPPAT
jgi:hypothetical protein